MQQAKLFQKDQHQAVLLPEDSHFEGHSVTIKRMGKTVVLLPSNEPWSTLFDSLAQFSPDFMDKREQPDLSQETALHRDSI